MGGRGSGIGGGLVERVDGGGWVGGLKGKGIGRFCGEEFSWR